MVAMMLGSKVAASGSSSLARVKRSIWQDPAFDIQILPAEEAWHSSSAVGWSAQEGGRTIQNEHERVRDRLGFFPVTSMLPRSTDTANMAIQASEGFGETNMA